MFTKRVGVDVGVFELRFLFSLRLYVTVMPCEVQQMTCLFDWGQ